MNEKSILYSVQTALGELSHPDTSLEVLDACITSYRQCFEKTAAKTAKATLKEPFKNLEHHVYGCLFLYAAYSRLLRCADPNEIKQRAEEWLKQYATIESIFFMVSIRLPGRALIKQKLKAFLFGLKTDVLIMAGASPTVIKSFATLLSGEIQNLVGVCTYEKHRSTTQKSKSLKNTISQGFQLLAAWDTPTVTVMRRVRNTVKTLPCIPAEKKFFDYIDKCEGKHPETFIPELGLEHFDKNRFFTLLKTALAQTLLGENFDIDPALVEEARLFGRVFYFHAQLLNAIYQKRDAKSMVVFDNDVVLPLCKTKLFENHALALLHFLNYQRDYPDDLNFTRVKTLGLPIDFIVLTEEDNKTLNLIDFFYELQFTLSITDTARRTKRLEKLYKNVTTIPLATQKLLYLILLAENVPPPLHKKIHNDIQTFQLPHEESFLCITLSLLRLMLITPAEECIDTFNAYFKKVCEKFEPLFGTTDAPSLIAFFALCKFTRSTEIFAQAAKNMLEAVKQNKTPEYQPVEKPIFGEIARRQDTHTKIENILNTLTHDSTALPTLTMICLYHYQRKLSSEDLYPRLPVENTTLRLATQMEAFLNGTFHVLARYQLVKRGSQEEQPKEAIELLSTVVAQIRQVPRDLDGYTVLDSLLFKKLMLLLRIILVHTRMLSQKNTEYSIGDYIHYLLEARIFVQALSKIDLKLLSHDTFLAINSLTRITGIIESPIIVTFMHENTLFSDNDRNLIRTWMGKMEVQAFIAELLAFDFETFATQLRNYLAEKRKNAALQLPSEVVVGATMIGKIKLLISLASHEQKNVLLTRTSPLYPLLNEYRFHYDPYAFEFLGNVIPPKKTLILKEEFEWLKSPERTFKEIDGRKKIYTEHRQSLSDPFHALSWDTLILFADFRLFSLQPEEIFKQDMPLFAPFCNRHLSKLKSLTAKSLHEKMRVQFLRLFTISLRSQSIALCASNSPEHHHSAFIQLMIEFSRYENLLAEVKRSNKLQPEEASALLATLHELEPWVRYTEKVLEDVRHPIQTGKQFSREEKAFADYVDCYLSFKGEAEPGEIPVYMKEYFTHLLSHNFTGLAEQLRRGIARILLGKPCDMAFLREVMVVGQLHMISQNSFTKFLAKRSAIPSHQIEQMQLILDRVLPLLQLYSHFSQTSLLQFAEPTLDISKQIVVISDKNTGELARDLACYAQDFTSVKRDNQTLLCFFLTCQRALPQSEKTLRAFAEGLPNSIENSQEQSEPLPETDVLLTAEEKLTEIYRCLDSKNITPLESLCKRYTDLQKTAPSKQEKQFYAALSLYAQCALVLLAEPATQETLANQWLEQCEALLPSLRYKHTLRTAEEKLRRMMLTSFLLACRAHVLHAIKKPRSIVMPALIHHIAASLNYQMLANTEGTAVEQTHRMQRLAPWNKYGALSESAVREALLQNKVSPAEDLAFLEFHKTSTAIEYLTCVKIPPTLLALIQTLSKKVEPNVSQKIVAAIAKSLREPETSLLHQEILENQAVILMQLSYLKLYLENFIQQQLRAKKPIDAELIKTHADIKTLIAKHWIAAHLFHIFVPRTHSFLAFLEADYAIYLPVTIKKLGLAPTEASSRSEFFRLFSVLTRHPHSPAKDKRLEKIGAKVSTYGLTPYTLCAVYAFLIAEMTPNKERNALLTKHFKPLEKKHQSLLFSTLYVLKIILQNNTVDEKKAALKKYLGSIAEKLHTIVADETVMMIFFLVCKLGLALNDPKLSAELGKVLSAIEKHQPSVQVLAKAPDVLATASLEEQLAAIESTSKKVASKKQPAKKSNKSATAKPTPPKPSPPKPEKSEKPKKIFTDAGVADLVDIGVATPLTATVEPCAMYRNIKKKWRQETSEVQTPLVSPPIRVASVMTADPKEAFVTTVEPTNVEGIPEFNPAHQSVNAQMVLHADNTQPQHAVALRGRSAQLGLYLRNPDVLADFHRRPCREVRRLFRLFNSLATRENNFRHALFLYGGALLSDHPNDWDLKYNGHLDVIHAILENKDIQKKWGIIRVERVGVKYPLLRVRFLEHSTQIIEISELHNANQGQLLPRVVENQKRLDYIPNTLFYTEAGGCRILIDSLGALEVINAPTIQLQRIDFEHSPENQALVYLRGIKFLATYKSVPTPAQIAWFENNKACLSSPATLEPLVKLLYSGRSKRALTWLQFFGSLEHLCPQLSALSETSENFLDDFDTQHSPGFRATADLSTEQYWQIHNCTVEFFLREAKIKIDPELDIETLPLLNDKVVTKTFIRQYWARNPHFFAKQKPADPTDLACYNPRTSYRGQSHGQ